MDNYSMFIMSLIGGVIGGASVMYMLCSEIKNVIRSCYEDEIASLKMQVLAIQIELNMNKQKNYASDEEAENSSKKIRKKFSDAMNNLKNK